MRNTKNGDRSYFFLFKEHSCAEVWSWGVLEIIINDYDAEVAAVVEEHRKIKLDFYN